MNTFKTSRLNLEQLGDRCLPSAGHMTADLSLTFQKITMTADVADIMHRHPSVIAPDATGPSGSGGGGGAGKVKFNADGLEHSHETTTAPDLVQKWFYGM